MKVELRGQSGLVVTDAMRNYLISSLNEISNVFDNDVFIDAKCKVEKLTHTVKISLKTKNNTMRVKSVSENFYDSVDDAVMKLKKNVRKYKDKLIDVKRRIKEKTLEEYLNIKLEDESFEKHGSLVKIKNIEVDTYSIEEALLQMNLLGHDFFLFIDEETEQPAVVYRRQDGSSGVIIKTDK